MTVHAMEERHHPIREAEQRRIQSLAEEITEVKKYLGSLEKQLAIAQGANLKYSGKKIKDAIYAFLDDTMTAHTEKEIADELETGGVVAGKRQARSQIGKSVDRLIRVGRLKRVGEKIGRAEWPGNKF